MRRTQEARAGWKARPCDLLLASSLHLVCNVRSQRASLANGTPISNTKLALVDTTTPHVLLPTAAVPHVEMHADNTSF